MCNKTGSADFLFYHPLRTCTLREKWFYGYVAVPRVMDPARATSTQSSAHRTVLIGTGGSVWPFVPRKLSGAFFFDYDAQRHTLVWGSGNSGDVLGMSEPAVIAHGAFLLAHVHAADKYRVESALHEAISTLAPYVCTYRWIRPDSQETRVLHIRAQLEADGSLLRGVVFDLSTEVPALQHHCDHLDAVGFAMNQLGDVGIIIDAEMRLRSLHGVISPERFSLGFQDFCAQALRPGMLFFECFSTESSKDEVRSLLARVIGGSAEARRWKGSSGAIRPITVGGVSQGVVIVFRDASTEEALDESLALIESSHIERENSRSTAGTLIDLSHEILGFSAIIARQATANPLLRHAAGALISTAKLCGQKAQELLRLPTPTASKTTPLFAKLPDRSAPARALPPFTSIVFASAQGRSAHTFAALLRDSGLHCSAVSLSEQDLREVLLKHQFVRVVIVDINADIRHGSTILRKLRRFFPALHFICLVPGPTEQHEDLRRAGADLLIAKPATPREIEQVVKGLLVLSSSQTGSR